MTFFYRLLARYGVLFSCFVLTLGLLFSFPLAGEAFPLPSSLNGLINLNRLAKESVPYDLALKDHNPIFLEFYASWCTTCQSMASSLDILHQKYGKEIDFVLLNIDDPKWKNTLEEFGVKGVPEIALLSADHQIIERWVGSVPESILESALVDVNDRLQPILQTN